MVFCVIKQKPQIIDQKVLGFGYPKFLNRRLNPVVMKNLFLLLFCVLCLAGKTVGQASRKTILFTDGWKFYKGDVENGEKEALDDASWRTVELPHDWSVE